MKQIIVVVSMLLLFIAVGIFGIKNSINPKQKIKNLNLSTDLILPTGTTDVIRIISNIEKEKKEFKAGVYYGSRSFLSLIRSGRTNITDIEVYNMSIIIRKQAKGEKK